MFSITARSISIEIISHDNLTVDVVDKGFYSSHMIYYYLN